MALANNGNNSMNMDVVSRLIAASTASLRTELEQVRLQLRNLSSNNNVTEYSVESIDSTIHCDESLDVIKSLPEFKGKINNYVSWREAANNSMSLYTRGSKKYFAALTILRNKLSQDANDILTNHGTVLNFDAILSRLDFAYADKRPCHIIEQEMSILRQGSRTLIEFYNEANKKLTLLTKKTIMTHGTNSAITNELNIKNRDTALRTFITGLNSPLDEILFTLAPKDLPNALAKAQELYLNQMRAQFAFHFSRNSQMINSRGPSQGNQRAHNFQNNLRYPIRTPQINEVTQNRPEPMDVDQSLQILNKPSPRRTNQSQVRVNRGNYQTNYQPNNVPKRGNDSAQISFQPQQKVQRINNLNENHFLD
uniref:Retrovirus-related Gag polyprotein from transposon gypsy n=1 Tax=Ceratitis capitata TaxID=7213 RepID=W8BTR9_CERCA